MRTLIALPEDMPYPIASKFERDRYTLVALNSTCHVLHRVTRSLLFGHIGGLSLRQIEQLERVFAVYAFVRAYVHSYPIYMEYGHILKDGLEKSRDCHNLRELKFTSSHQLSTPGVIGMEWNASIA
jgi:hypothetical protein